MITVTFLPLVEDPPLAWTGEDEGGVIHMTGEYPLSGPIFYQNVFTFHSRKALDLNAKVILGQNAGAAIRQQTREMQPSYSTGFVISLEAGSNGDESDDQFHSGWSLPDQTLPEDCR